MKLTAREIYNTLVNDDKIFEQKGQIKFYLGDVAIIVRQKDVVGNIIQEWLKAGSIREGWNMLHRKTLRCHPIFFLTRKIKKMNLLEVKAFNRSATPGFDIADFRMYEEEIVDKPYMLDVDYLIFGYDMSDDGVVTIKDLWLKKVWQITRRMSDWPINLQVKQGVVHKIRPGVWYNSKKGSYPMFSSLEDFISAIEETVYQNPKTHNAASMWKKNFLSSYKNFYGVSLKIPRWDDIVDKYTK